MTLARSPAPGSGRLLPMVVTVAVLAGLSFAIRIPCILDPEPSVIALALPGCGDLRVMWHERGLAAGYVPYLQPVVDPVTGQLMTVEYPVLTGMLMWLLSRSGSLLAFAGLSTAVMGLAAISIAVLLHRWTGSRAWLWAAAPALLHYLCYNYDALPALTVVIALTLVLTQAPPAIGTTRILSAAAVLGVGGGLKLYPLLFVLPLTLWLAQGEPGLRQHPAVARLGRAALALVTAAGVFVAVNLPFALANPQGWWLPFRFQASRAIDPTTLSIWNLLSSIWPGAGQAVWMTLASVSTAIGILFALVAGWLVGRTRGSYPLLGVGMAVLIAYMLLNKVHSPQYILWLLPLLVLAGLQVRHVVLYLVVDVVMFWSVGIVSRASGLGSPGLSNLATTLLVASIIVRWGMLAWLGIQAVPRAGPSRLDAPRRMEAAAR